METAWVDTQGPFYSTTKLDDILILSFFKQPIRYIFDLDFKEDLLSILDIANRSDEIKVILIQQSPDKVGREEYIDFFDELIRSGYEQLRLERMFTAVNQFILKLVNLDKIVIHADSGDVVHFFMNMGLVCDYRIVADNTVFQNPHLVLGVVPKGAGAYFLSRMVGRSATRKILLSKGDISATEAHRLGIVDEVVPVQELEEAAIDAAQRAARLPHLYAAGIKKLINHGTKDLEEHLDFENEIIRKQVQSCYRAKTAAGLAP